MPNYPIEPAKPPSAKACLWQFDCRHWPELSERDCSVSHGNFKAAVNELLLTAKNKQVESRENWPSYFHWLRDFDNFCDAHQDMLNYADEMKGILPSKMVNNVFFNRKLGVAFFRAGVAPNYDNMNGGFFRRFFKANNSDDPENRELFRKIDEVCLRALQCISQHPHDGVLGLMYRCDIHPGNGKGRGTPPKEQPFNYDDKNKLPVLARLEVWFDDRRHQKTIQDGLINELDEAINRMGFPVGSLCGTKFKFHSFPGIKRAQQQAHQ